MTKEEYLTRECHKTCGEGICDVNCPHLRDLAKAWDACEKENKKQLTLLAAKILESLGAGLPSCYYEAMEKVSLEAIADTVVARIRVTKINKD